MAELNARHFTIEEANLIVAVIRPFIREILEIRQNILRMQADVWPVIEKSIGNGGSQAASLAVKEFDRLEELVRQVQSSGAILKDINLGLVDFLGEREGRDVYLCWKFGEAAVEFWHDLESGFSGRQPW